MITAAQKRRIKRGSTQEVAIIKIAASLAKSTGSRAEAKCLGRDITIASPAHKPGGLYRLKLSPENLEQLREAFGKTRKEFATMLGISSGHYSRIESGYAGYDPTCIIAARLAATVKGLEVEFEDSLYYCAETLSPVPKK